MDILVALFRKCARMGIEVPADMALDTPERQRFAACLLGGLIIMAREEL